MLSLLRDLEKLARFVGTQTPALQPDAAGNALFTLVLNPETSTINTGELRCALEGVFLVATTQPPQIDPSRILAGVFGLQAVVAAFRRLQQPESLAELTWWLEALVHGALSQSWRYRSQTSALRDVVVSLECCRDLESAKALFPGSIIPVEIQILVNPWMAEAHSNPFNRRESISELLVHTILSLKRPLEGRRDERGEKRGRALEGTSHTRTETRSHTETIIHHHHPATRVVQSLPSLPPIYTSGPLAAVADRPARRAPTSLPKLSTVLPEVTRVVPPSIRVSSDPTTVPVPRPSRHARAPQTYFWSKATQHLLQYPHPMYTPRDGDELLEFEQDSYVGNLEPSDAAINDFIRQQRCVPSCAYVSTKTTKPIRIREHFSRCPARKAWFDERGGTDVLARLATLQMVALRSTNAANETKSSLSSPVRGTRRTQS